MTHHPLHRNPLGTCLLLLLAIQPCWGTALREEDECIFETIDDNNNSDLEHTLTVAPIGNVNVQKPGTLETPLHKACSEGKETIVNTLCKYNANKNALTKDMNTPLHAAVRGGKRAIVQHVMTDYNKNFRNLAGQTPLHIALEQNKKDIAQCLIERGADLNLPDSLGNTPFTIIAAKKDMNADAGAYKALYDLCLNPNATPHMYNSIFEAIHNNNNTDLERALTVPPIGNVNVQKPGTLETPLHKACSEGKETIVNTLCKHKANKNAPTKDMNTPLHAAVRGGKRAIVQHVITDYNKNFPNLAGQTPLHIALERNKKDIAQYLIEQGADQNLPDSQGNTPFTIIRAKKDMNADAGAYKALYDLCLTQNPTPHIYNKPGTKASMFAPSNENDTPPNNILHIMVLFKCLEGIVCYLFYKKRTHTNHHEATPKPSHQPPDQPSKNQHQDENKANQPNPTHQDTNA